MRHGTFWLCVEPARPVAHGHATTRRTGRDWAHPVKTHPRYRQAEYLTRVCDNLNTHTYASLHRAFPPAEA